MLNINPNTIVAVPEAVTKRNKLISIAWWQQQGWKCSVDSLGTILFEKEDKYNNLSQITIRTFDQKVTAVRIMRNKFTNVLGLSVEEMRRILVITAELKWRN